MRLKQIEYVLAIARTGSFSKAASELYLSQPNISSSISALEKELGYDIFHRTNKGITLTREGNLFLKYATNITEELRRMNTINERQPHRKFFVETMFNHTLVSQAFSRLCQSYKSSSQMNFSIQTNTANDILENVYLGKADLGLMIINKVTLDTYENTLPKRGIFLEQVGRLNLNINIGRDHPLLKDNRLDFKNLNQYPHVSYNYNLISDFPEVFSMGLINPNNIIITSDSTTRGQIITSTDAFGIGCDPHPSSQILDYIVSIPIPNLEALLVIIHQTNQSSGDELANFKKYLKDELDKLKL